MRIAVLTTDSREHYKHYQNAEPYFGSAPEALLRGFEEMPDLQVHVISCLRRKIASPQKIAANIWYHGLPVAPIGWLRTGYQGCIRAVGEKLRQIRPDIVHAQGTERDCAMEGAFSNFPRVLTIHGNMRHLARLNNARPFSYAWFAARLEHLVIPRFDGVICITKHTQRLVSERARQTWIVPNAVDPAFFQVRPAFISESAMVCVGTISYTKNQNGLIEALDPLRSELPFHVKFYGLLPPDEYGRNFSRLLAARPWCHHEGLLDRAGLRKALGEAALLVLPSHEDNCPMVILEAMAAGIPVAAAAVGGIPELIQHESTGLLFPPDSPVAIKTAISRLLRERDFACQLATRARAEASKRFHPGPIAAEHLRIYGEVRSNRS
jgi:glycosyltransferase involved in cell wall biosynthesis